MSNSLNLTQEFIDRADNGEVGDALVSETDRVRVWHIHAPGRARNHQPDGTFFDVEYQAGDTKHFTFQTGERMTHSLENIGYTDLIFTTVEFKDSANDPLPINVSG